MNTYRVNEIFYSLQGEGFFTGTPAVFLRLSGCNLRCSFCDTDHFASEELTAAEIVAKAAAHPARHIVVTGGEPTLQLDDELVSLLHDMGFFIQIETNGTHPVPEGVDWITCSPKPDSEPVLERVDELKIVYQGQDVDAIASSFNASHYFLQPCSGENIELTVDYILSHPYWRLSLQTHKLINIP